MVIVRLHVNNSALLQRKQGKYLANFSGLMEIECVYHLDIFIGEVYVNTSQLCLFEFNIQNFHSIYKIS